MITTVISTDGVPTRLERRRFRLRVINGAATGLVKEFADDTATIGSADTNALAVADPSVSRHHARIEVREDHILVRDLGSTNGTFVAGLRVGSAFLGERTTIRVGETDIAFELTNDVETLPLSDKSAFGNMLGQSVAMRRVFATLERIGGTDATVLIEGESGTGKEMVAEALHESSARKDGPFVIVDCGALPTNLIESELFGHEKGAFTGAIASRAGAFEQANGGTLFLDELGELDPALQSRLLRALDRRRVKRVGSGEYVDVDVRIVAATNRDLEEMVALGEFREDLFYRLAVVRLHLPALRKRPDDVEMLARHFIELYRTRHPTAPPFELTAEIVRALRARAWRGNVRELRNFIERAVVLASPELLGPTGEPTDPAPSDTTLGIAFERTYAEARDAWVGHFEREYIQRALSRTGGNVAAAARECNVDRAYLFRLIKKHDIDR